MSNVPNLATADLGDVVREPVTRDAIEAAATQATGKPVEELRFTAPEGIELEPGYGSPVGAHDTVVVVDEAARAGTYVMAHAYTSEAVRRADVIMVALPDMKQADVYEQDVGLVKQGAKALVEVGAYPGQRFEGTVRDARHGGGPSLVL